MTTFFSKGRVSGVVLGAVFGLLAAGCEGYVGSESSKTVWVPALTAPASTNSPSEEESVPTNTSPAVVTNTTSVVLNDDPNCLLVLKYNNRDIPNDGQVHYVKRVLTSDPFESANPTCVQYNDTQTGEVTVWKDLSSTGQRVDILPSDRGIDKIVVWYN